MKYGMEELLPIIRRITEKYTGKSSTSVTYEKAEQLMGAVIYCIQEYEASGGRQAVGKTEVYTEKVDAAQAYEAGYKIVLEKTYQAKEYYEEILEVFDSYGSECCYDTVIKGIPEFFLRYDARFSPQNHILTLDYPLIKAGSNDCGIDLIGQYLKNLLTEQRFLSLFPKKQVMAELENYQPGYKSLFLNIGGVVIRALSWKVLAYGYEKEKGALQIKEWVEGMEVKELEKELLYSYDALIQKIPENEIADEAFRNSILEYGKPAICDFASELKSIPVLLHKYCAEF